MTRQCPARSLRTPILLLLALLLLLAPAAPAGGASAQPSPTATPVVVDGLPRDAQEYATTFGVDLAEATRRLQRQGAIGALNAALTGQERATFAGLRVEHRPAYRVIAQFTRDGEQTLRPYLAGGPLAGLVEVRAAQRTLAELEAAQKAALTTVRPLGVPVNAGINVAANRAELYVVERARLDDAIQRSSRQLPDGVVVLTVPELARPADVYAGLPIANGCTTGFSVAGPQGLGTTTAAHCGHDLGPGFTFIYEWEYGPYDLQWHTTPGQTVRSWAYDGVPSYRHVTGTRARGDQYDGEWVCKYGRTTGYGCGQIADRYFASTWPNDDHSFVRVHHPEDAVLIRGGDSGGPWYNGGTAYGMTHANFGNDGIYMAINYVQYTGLTVLVNCPVWGC
jgi:hypothetical protein